MFPHGILGLMKRQMGKNSVIVPVGSKACLWCNTHLDCNRYAVMEEGLPAISCILQAGSIYSNLVPVGQVTPPPHVVRMIR